MTFLRLDLHITPMDLIARNIRSSILEKAKKVQVLFIHGSQKSGKTLCVQQLFPDYKYVSLENPFILVKAEDSPQNFMQDINSPVIFDEIHNAPDLLSHIGELIQENQISYQIIFISSDHADAVIEHAGIQKIQNKIEFIQFPTLEAKEVLQANPQETLENLIFRGSFPEVWQTKTDQTTWYPSYISHSLIHIFQNYTKTTSTITFYKFLQELALCSGTILNYSDLAHKVDKSHATIKSWVNILQAKGIISLINGWASDQSQRLVKAPKLYFNDTGLLCTFLGISQADKIRESPLFSIIWETWIFVQLRNYLANNFQDGNIWHWKTIEGKSLPFVVQSSMLDYIYVFDCKTHENLTLKDIAKLFHFGLKNTNASLQKVLMCPTSSSVERFRTSVTKVNNGCNLDTIFKEPPLLQEEALL